MFDRITIESIKDYTNEQFMQSEVYVINLYNKMFDNFCSCMNIETTKSRSPIVLRNNATSVWNTMNSKVVQYFKGNAVKALLFHILGQPTGILANQCLRIVLYIFACNNICVTFNGSLKKEAAIAKKICDTTPDHVFYSYMGDFDALITSHISVEVIQIGAYPAGLLQELEECSSIVDVLDTVLRYQMLSPEAIRKDNAKEALLIGYNFSKDSNAKLFK